MSLSLYKVETHHLADLSPEEIDVIESLVYKADDGTFYLEPETLESIKDRISSELYQDLKEELRKDGDFNFIFS